MPIVRFCLSTLTLAGCSFVAAAAQQQRDLAPLLSEVREKTHAPGLAAAVMRDGALSGAGVTGVRQLNEPAAVERGDLLMIGSCGKSLTRLLIGRLVDRKLLSFESTLKELLPDVPMRDEYARVSVADLLAHRGGIQPYTEIGPRRTPRLFELTGTPREQRAAFVAHVLNEPPAATPGARMVYSNAGYGLLGHIAERLLKQSFEDALRAEVFEPLAMKSAIVGLPNSGPGRTGLFGHRRDGQTYRPVAEAREPLAAIAPAGMMSCSIDDFARFAAQLAANEAGKPGKFLSDGTARKLREARPGDHDGEGEIFFGGEGTYTAAFALWPSRGVAIVVGTNAGDSDDVCEAAIDAIRAACAPDIAARRAARDDPAANGPRYGFMIRADDSGRWTVDRVEAGSAAARGGLKAGDVITAIDGEALDNIPEEQRGDRLRKSPLKLSVERDGRSVELLLKHGD